MLVNQKQNYTALNIDIKSSRKLTIEQRLNYQRALKSYLDRLNELFRDDLKYPVVFSAGDSVQGLFYTTSSAYAYFLFVQALLFPIEIRGGLGVGGLTVDMNDFDSNMQDGPAYYRSREAIDYAKKKDYTIVLHSTKVEDLYINELLYTIERLEEDLTAKRKQVALFIDFISPLISNILDSKVFLDLVTHFFEQQEIQKTMLPLIRETMIERESALDKEVLSTDRFPRFYDRSLVMSLAPLLGEMTLTSRQNIAQMIKQGKIIEIRHLKQLVLSFLNQYDRNI